MSETCAADLGTERPDHCCAFDEKTRLDPDRIGGTERVERGLGETEAEETADR